MCNRYRNRLGWTDYAEDFSELKIPLVFDPSRIPNLEPRDDIRPTNRAVVFRPVDAAAGAAGGLELAQIRWGLVPFFSKEISRKFLCTNARSETVATTASYREPFKRRRCLVPADGYYEWTGEKGAKTKWLFTAADGRWFAFPGLWDSATVPNADGEPGRLESFTLLTCAPGPGLAQWHDRQPVILPRDRWADWLDLGRDPADLLVASPEGAVVVEKAPPEAARA